jgi:hypothetical protein
MAFYWLQHGGFAEQPVPPEALYDDRDQEELLGKEPHCKFQGK